MTRVEFDAYFKVQQEFQSLPLTVGYASQVPSLFQLLDTDNDGRLSVRELRNAYSRMRDLEPGNGENITRAAIQAISSQALASSSGVYSPSMTPSDSPEPRISTRTPAMPAAAKTG